MPIIPGGTYPIVGMSPATIIDMATRRTGKRGVYTLDLNTELLIVIQDFCAAKRWSWRKQTIDIELVLNTGIYNLITAPLNYPDVEQIETLQLVIAPDNVVSLTEVRSVMEQGQILESDDTGQPDKFFQRNFYDLIIFPAPNATYVGLNLRMNYWAIPDTILDSHGVLLLGVPLVPQFLHKILVKGLEAQILRYTVGEESTKYQDTQAEYQEQIGKAAQP